MTSIQQPFGVYKQPLTQLHPSSLSEAQPHFKETHAGLQRSEDLLKAPWAEPQHGELLLGPGPSPFGFFLLSSSSSSLPALPSSSSFPSFLPFVLRVWLRGPDPFRLCPSTPAHSQLQPSCHSLSCPGVFLVPHQEGCLHVPLVLFSFLPEANSSPLLPSRMTSLDL